MLTIRNYFLVFFIGLSSVTFGQGLNPSHPYPNSIDSLFSWGETATYESTRATKMIKDNAGNLLIIGEYTGTFDMDPGTGVLMAANSIGQGLFLTKLDTNKNLVWSLAWPENKEAELRDMEVDAANNIYLSGYFTGSAFDIDPISSQFVSGVDSLFGQSTANSILLKISANGSLLWGKSLKGGARMEILSLDQKLTVAAEFRGGLDTTFNHSNPQYKQGPTNNNFGGLAFFKLDTANGNVLTQVHTSGTANVWLRDALLNDGFYYLTGSFFLGNLDFDPSPTQTRIIFRPLGQQTYVLKLDTAFNYSNHIVLQGSSINRSASIQSQNNRIWISGYYTDYANMDLDPGPAVLNPIDRDRLYGGQYYLAFNANLNLVRHFYFPQGFDFSQLSEAKLLFKGGATYVYSMFYQILHLEPQKTNGLKIDLSFLPVPKSRTSFYVVKVASTDSIEWVYYPDRVSTNDTTYTMQGDFLFEDDKLLLLGNLYNTVDFDLSPNDTAKLRGNKWSNFLLTLNDCVNPNTLPVVNRSYAVCDTALIGDTLLTANGWHSLNYKMVNQAGCDSIRVRDSVFVFHDKPTLENKGTYLEVNLTYPK